MVKTDAERRAWKFAYDEFNRVTKVTDPAGVLAEVRAYTPNGRLFTTQDANANVTTFEWDGFDRLSKQIYPDTTFEEYTFDENSNVLVRVTRNGDSVTMSYDPLNRVETQEPTGLALRTLTFDLAGRLTKMSTPVVGGDPTTGDYEFSFDTAGRLVQQTTPAGQSIDCELDENGNRTKLTWPDTYFAQYFFDELNRLTDIKLNGSTDAAAHFVYDALSRRIGLDYGNDCTSSYSYWSNDDMSMLAHNFVGSDVSFAFGCNAVHQVTNQLVSDDTFVWNPLASNLTCTGRRTTSTSTRM